MMASQDEAFQQLKPPAVTLSQAILKLVGRQADKTVITSGLKELQAVVIKLGNSGRLDAKLADYVFFPVSQVLKHSQQVSLEALELSLAIVSVLITKGWRSNIQHQLSQQLLILCTILTSETPTAVGLGNASPELRVLALECIAAIYEAFMSADRAAAVDDINIAQLGQTISSVLEATQQSSIPDIQLAGTKALRAIVQDTKSHELQSSFLPGIVSSLTKVLTPSSKHKRPAAVLVACLDVLSNLLAGSFGKQPRSSSLKQRSITPTEQLQRKESNADGEAAPKIKAALSQIARLQAHDRNDVRDGLGRLCTTIIRECADPLATCVQLAMEIMITLCARSGSRKLELELAMLITSSPKIANLLQDSLHTWSQSLARVIQSTDEAAKIKRLDQIGTAYQCMANAGLDLTLCDRMLAQSLKDSVVLTLQSAKAPVSLVAQAEIQSIDLASSTVASNTVRRFRRIASSPAQEDVLSHIKALSINMVNANAISTAMSSLAKTLPYAKADDLSASLWLLLQVLSTDVQQANDLEDMIDLDYTLPGSQAVLDDMYSVALSILTTEEVMDQRHISLAIQALALRAQSVGKDFRYELIDALYPVLHTMATPNEHLQHDSIVALNMIASACQYSSVQELIVDNVDYLTNAIALKLNAFDISPQAPQVLLMMVRLAGPKLLPYLEDTIESIFAALEDFHGYPLLVELLFKTLAVITEEGSKTPLLLTTNAHTGLLQNGLGRWQPTSAADLALRLRERADEEAQEQVEMANSQRERAPQEPWTSTEVDEARSREVEEETKEPPAPKTYALLHKITELTQHYLPAASPSLRLSLLSLIRTTVPGIAKHEETFLPLINTLWPEIVARLDDPEPAIRASTFETIGSICIHAKDFMRSRIGDLLPHIHRMWKQMGNELPISDKSMLSAASLSTISDSRSRSTELVQSTEPMHEDGNTAALAIWQAMLNMIVAVVQSVPLQPELFDLALDMVQTRLNDADIMAAFCQENADAVWLARLRRGMVQPPKRLEAFDQRWARIPV